MKIEPVWVWIGDPNESKDPNFPNSQRVSPAKPVELGEWNVPEQIKCEFLLNGVQARVKTQWRIEMTIQFEKLIPHTKKVSVSVEGKSGNKNYPHAERIEISHLLLTSSNLRELEALAIQSAIRRWKFNSKTKKWTALAGEELSQKEISSMRKEFFNRTSYKTLSDEFLKEVARLFIEAESKGERTNIFVANEIGRREGRVRSVRTSEKWIAEARKKGFLSLPNRKKTTKPRKGKTK